MKTNVFVKTENVKRLVSLLDRIKKLSSNVPKLALVYGEHGIGKTHSLIWWATRNDAIYIRANNEITQGGLLKEIVLELGERPYYRMQDNYDLIIKNLRMHPQTLIVDEVDYLIDSKNVIEIIRDIQDNTGTPIILAGMGMVDKKIARYKHFDDRLFRKLKFKHFNEKDIREILKEISDLQFTDDAVLYLATRMQQFRKIVQTLEEIEKIAETNSIKEIDEYTLRRLLNERQNIKVVSQAEKDND